MIVSIGLGDTGVNVCLDDEIEGYCPTRTAEMARLARRLFRQAYRDTVSEAADDVAASEAEG